MSHIISNEIIAAVRGKRQFQARNLRIEWPTTIFCILRWDHPENGAPSSYRLIHAAIVISDGTVTSTYRNLQLPGTNRLAQLTSVNRNDLNIFLLNAIYATSHHSSLFFSGKFSHWWCNGFRPVLFNAIYTVPLPSKRNTTSSQKHASGNFKQHHYPHYLECPSENWDIHIRHSSLQRNKPDLFQHWFHNILYDHWSGAPTDVSDTCGGHVREPILCSICHTHSGSWYVMLATA